MTPMDIQQILACLPHRYPFLMVDRVMSVAPGERLVAIKNVTVNEPFFMGHFPQRPVMPGVMIVEALAQAAGILAYLSATEAQRQEGALLFLAGVDNARFKKVVTPGDTLQLEVEFLRAKREFTKYSGVAKVDDHVVCSTELMSAKEDSARG